MGRFLGWWVALGAPIPGTWGRRGPRSRAAHAFVIAQVRADPGSSGAFAGPPARGKGGAFPPGVAGAGGRVWGPRPQALRGDMNELDPPRPGRYGRGENEKEEERLWGHQFGDARVAVA